jgi:predicted nucleic acid-binding protein
MERYLIDSNVISNYFLGLISEQAMNFIADVIDQTPNISVITAIESLSWRCPDKRKEAIVKSFVENANVYGLSPAVVAQCVSIRRSKKIKTPDAIIAATAIVHNFTLLTSDSDFNCIAELKVINPYAIIKQTSE